MLSVFRQQARSLSQRITRSLVTEASSSGASSSSATLQKRSIPTVTPQYPNPEAFLRSLGRSSEKKLKVETWDDLWKMNGVAMKKQGVTVQDRRYILWAMEKFRQGESPSTFSHEPKGKKKIRGRGPAVQNGKRIRSRRKQ